MRMARIDIFRRDYSLRHPSVVAYEALETAANVAVRIETGNGEIGWGNAAPDEHVTGETAEGVERMIREVFLPRLLGRDPRQIETIWHELRELAPRAPSAIAAVDIALYDLLGKTAGLPLVSILGQARREIKTTVTLSIETIEQNLARAREFLSQGFQAIKIKCGTDPDADIERIRAIRQEVGERMMLTLDANQGYSVSQTLRVLDAVRDCRVEFIEQPVPAGDWEALRELCARSPIPVMADESVLDANDVLRTPAPLVNLKLMKTGGITGLLKCNAVAEARGIGVMIGCMDESRISMAAAAHLALALHNVAYADLDGHLDLIEDVAGEGIRIDHGMVTVPDLPGLGVNVDPIILGNGDPGSPTPSATA